MKRRITKMKLAQLSTAILLAFLLYKYYLINQNIQETEINVVNQSDIEFNQEDFLLFNQTANDSNNANVFDLRRKLEPAKIYDSIRCRKSLKYIVKTTLCVHDTKDDVHVSGSIWNEGIWEKRILRQFVDFLNENKDYLVLDIGAHIGLYSLMAAKLGNRVLAVEPFEPNNLRLHKAATIERLRHKITLIQNAISNKRNEIKMLQQTRDNIGGQTLFSKHINKTFIKNSTNHYLVETILFDDLVKYLPKKNNETYKKAILKIDIEGFEPIAFQHAQTLFDTIDISMVFMEWGTIASDRIQTILYDQIIQMIDFFKRNNYEPYDQNFHLEIKKWTYDWPWDVVWKKK